MAKMSARSPWRQRLRWEHWVATSVTIALHLAAGRFLVGYSGADASAPAGQDQVIQISFIERAPEAAKARAAAKLRRHKPETGPRPATAQALKIAATQAQPAGDFASVRDPLDATGQLQNFSLPQAPISFERKLFARRPARVAEAPVRMPLTFTDRSFGGLMQRVTSASLCRDLRMRLSASPESAARIMASMQRIGCKG